MNQDEVVLVTKKDGDWWTGIIGERSGIFPSNYVQYLDPQVKLLIFISELKKIFKILIHKFDFIASPCSLQEIL